MLLLASIPALAGTAETGSLEFRVQIEHTNRPAEGVRITLSTDPSVEVVTDGHGRAAFASVPTDRVYTARFEKDGFAVFVMDGIRVAAGQNSLIAVAMVRALTHTVRVGVPKPIVELESPVVESRFDDAFIRELPIPGRSFQSLLTLAPGVLDPNGDGNPNVHGARERDFKTAVGGLSNQDPLTGKWLGQISLDGIAALELIPAGAGAEFSRAQGGFANAVPKQGGNDLDGSIGLIMRSSRLDGRGASGLAKESVPEFRWIQPTLNLSGPIAVDRLWYRLSHEFQDIGRPVNLGSRVAVSNHRQWIHDDQLTWQVSPRNLLSLRAHRDRTDDANLGLSSLRPPETNWNERFSGTSAALTWTAPVSSKLLAETQLSWQQYGLRRSPTTSGLTNRCVAGIASIEAAQCVNTDNGTTTGSFGEDWSDSRQRLTLSSKATWYAGRLGKATQTLRGGFTIENERYTRDVTRRPTISFHAYRPPPVFFPDGSVYIPPRIGLAATTFMLPASAHDSAVETTTGLWVEDQIHLGSSLLVTLGLRYDREEFVAPGWAPIDPAAEAREFLARRTGDIAIDSLIVRDVFTASGELVGREGMEQQLESIIGYDIQLSPTASQSLFWSKSRGLADIRATNGNLAPRLAVSWDPLADGKTKITATLGRYYDKIFLAVPLVEREPSATNLVLETFEWEGKFYFTYANLVSGVNPGVDARVVDHRLRTPYQDEIALAAERELPIPETSVRLAFIQRRFKDQLQDVDINRITGDIGRCASQQTFGAPYVVSSPGSGQILFDPYTGEQYDDSDPGIGDGRVDDCAGNPIFVFNHYGRGFVQRPDGIADLYVQNPAWGSIYRIGNYNRAVYKALQLELRHRRSHGWEGLVAYTFSRAKGDAEDYQQTLGNDGALLEDERGYLSYDQRHVVKLQATRDLGKGARLGAAVTWQSGLPYSILLREFSFDSAPPYYGSISAAEPKTRIRYPTGQRNDQRNPSYWNVDLRVEKDFTIGKRATLQLSAEVFNALNDGTYTIWSPSLGYGQNLDGVNDGYRRFGREWQLGIRVGF